MGFYVVARPTLSRDLIVSFLASEGLAIEAILATLPELPDGDPAPAVLVHMGTFEPAFKEDLLTFRGRFPDAQVLLFAAEQVRGLLDQDILANIETVLSDRAQMQTFRGILQSLQGETAPEGLEDPPLTVGPVSACTAQKAAALPAGAMLQETVSGETDLAPPAPPPPTLTPAGMTMRTHLTKLSQRELTVLIRLRDGGSNKQIADDLEITESTVKVHLRACYRKIGVQNRTQAALWAAKNLPPT